MLFLDSHSPMDLFVTLGNFATRAKAFAMRNPEILHWKHRPKPVNLQLQMPAKERLAHTLLCFLIAKQVGTVVSSDDVGVPRKPTGFTESASAKKDAAGAPPPTFTMEETRYDCFLTGLLTAVMFCRSLTAAQRAEVDRLLSLLIYASTDMAWMRRAFPWLELDDDRLSCASAGTGSQDGDQHRGRSRQDSVVDSPSHTHRSLTRGSLLKRALTTMTDERAQNDKDAALRRKLVTNSGGAGRGNSLLLFELQQIWLGWLSTACGEIVPASCSERKGKSGIAKR